MNIADLVTQVHGGEEEEDEELQQDATLVANKADGAHANAQPPPPPLEQDDNAPPPPRHGLCYRLFCCLPCRSQPKNDRKAQNGAGAGGGEGGGGGGGARGANGKAAVPMQSSDRSGANGGALSNPNHSRVDNTPSVSASGVTLQGASNRQQSTVGLNSRDGSGGLAPKQHSIPALQQPTQQQYDSSSLSLQQQQAHQQSILAQQQALLAQPTAPLRDSNNIVTPPPAKYLLGPLSPEDVGRKCLVLDLDETLVHSSFKPIPNADFVINIELESVIHRVYVRKRPGVDHFMRVVAEKFEVVIFTASLSKYADPLLDILDRNRVVKARLFREACVQHYGNYVKDLSHLGRRMEDILIVDNSPFSYMFQNDNAIPITSWFNDKNDRQLWELIPYLDVAAGIDNVQMLVRSRKPAYGSGVGVPPNLLPPGWQPSIQDADVMNAQQRRGQ